MSKPLRSRPIDLYLEKSGDFPSMLRVDPAAVDTVLEMVGQKGPPKVQLYDNAIVDRLAQEGFIDKLCRGAKP